MADAQIGFLYNASSTLVETERNPTQLILRSHYLMRCMQITKGYGLPEKHFSSKTRCPHCCNEWQRDTMTKIHSIKLSKRQKKRLKSRKPTLKNPDPKSILHSNQLERICTFCSYCMVTPVLKPTKRMETLSKNDKRVTVAAPNNTPKQNKSKSKQPAEKKTETSIYYNAKQVFSLNNKNNALASSTKPNKIIKNNKRKKDKFAGLCQQAVLTSAILKEGKDKNSLLSKFLKSSS